MVIPTGQSLTAGGALYTSELASVTSRNRVSRQSNVSVVMSLVNERSEVKVTASVHPRLPLHIQSARFTEVVKNLISEKKKNQSLP